MGTLFTFDFLPLLNNIHPPVAQLVEQLPLKEMVAGSNPAGRRMEFYIVEKVTLDAGSNFTRVKFPGTRS